MAWPRHHPHPGRMKQWLTSNDLKLGLVSKGMVIQHEQVHGQLDLAVYTTPAVPPSSKRMRLLGPIVAAAVSEAVRKDTGVVSWLHWPNLVSIDGKIVGKTSLSSFQMPVAQGNADPRRALVMAASVNCFAPNRSASTEPSETSLLEVLGVELDLVLLRERVLESVDWYYAEWERGMNRKLVRRIEPTISWIGRRVRIKTARDTMLTGRAVGLRDDGSLLLTQDGTTTLAVVPERVEDVRVLP